MKDYCKCGPSQQLCGSAAGFARGERGYCARCGKAPYYKMPDVLRDAHETLRAWHDVLQAQDKVTASLRNRSRQVSEPSKGRKR